MINEKIINKMKIEFNINRDSVLNIIKLLDEGNTIPFISRYRKNLTENMSSENLYKFQDRLEYLKKLENRKNSIIKALKDRNQLTKEIEDKIKAFDNIARLEEFYEPFIPRKDSPATVAKEKGLEPLSKAIKNLDFTSFKNELEKVKTEKNIKEEESLEGARDIIFEELSLDHEIKNIARYNALEKCKLNVKIKKKEKEDNIYNKYDGYVEDIYKIPSHRILALFRGTKDKKLQLKLQVDDNTILNKIKNRTVRKDGNEFLKKFMYDIIDELYSSKIRNYIEKEVKKELFKKAEERAIEVFSNNLKNLLMQKPVKDKVIMGIDPGYKTGCKIAIIDKNGSLKDKNVVYITPPNNLKEQGEEIILNLINKNKVDVIAIGNGTASRETEYFIRDFLKKHKNLNVCYSIVSEAGASVYSASKEAEEEFPDLDVYYRSAISIARRLQDPLAELIKINPRNLGIGQYQHDVDAKKLKKELERTIITCVNEVGVDVNTASYQLLSYVSGLNKTSAKNIVEYRNKKGKIENREEIYHIKGIGPKTYQQCIGFLKIYNGTEKLDSYMIHPENYSLAKKLIKIKKDTYNLKENEKLSNNRIKEIAEKLGVDLLVLSEIEKALTQEQDIRDVIGYTPNFKKDVKDIEDLHEGMIVEGVVSNVLDFGAFIDIGLHGDCLLHKSEISYNYVKDPADYLKVGEKVFVKILSIDMKNKRVNLTMK